MKTKEFKDLRNKDLKSLNKMVSEKKVLLTKKLMEIQAGKEKNLKAGMNIRREIAKILTLIKEKQIMEELVKKGDAK
jgi:ribosomal protein L29